MNKPVTTLTATLIASLFAASAFAADTHAPKSAAPVVSTSATDLTPVKTMKHTAKHSIHKKTAAKTEDKK